MFENKKIFILGMARSGYESAKLLARHGCEILITDAKEQDQNHINELNELGVKFILTDKAEDLLDDTFDYVIKNPGIKIEHPVCLKAEKLNIRVVSEVDVAYSFLPKVNIIAITGSNGKTTTTTLVYEFLKQANKNVLLGGNIGYPVCSLVEKAKDNDILVLEISGHQLHDCELFKTNVSIMTNLSQVHIDHFGSYENYKANKAKVFNNQTENDIAIYNIGNNDVKEIVDKLNRKRISFTAKENIKSDLYIKDKAIYYKDELIIHLNDIKLQGNHNYENIMCAIAATMEYGVTKENIFNVLNRFNGVEHRIEYVNTINGIDFYNDSKATNVESTQIALKAFSKPTILLLGGLDRGHSFDGLTEYMKNVKLVVCYGQTKERIKEYCNKINIPCTIKDTLKDATIEAYNNANNGYVVLLSPACASWDQYDSFEVRGKEFKDTVNNLK